MSRPATAFSQTSIEGRDGLLMPARKDQAPPDLKYFKRGGGKTP
jgi:hypothetical protein